MFNPQAALCFAEMDHEPLQPPKVFDSAMIAVIAAVAAFLLYGVLMITHVV